MLKQLLEMGELKADDLELAVDEKFKQMYTFTVMPETGPFAYQILVFEVDFSSTSKGSQGSSRFVCRLSVSCLPRATRNDAI